MDKQRHNIPTPKRRLNPSVCLVQPHPILDPYVSMPNHTHAIIIITDAGQCRRGGSRTARVRWDHIVRNEPELHRIREYIQNNPGQWERDSLNADTGGSRTAPTPMPKHIGQRPNRRSIRLQGYDYSQAGAYFVTICTHNRECLFGEIINGDMRLNDVGRIVADSWQWLAEQYDHVLLDQYVIMPNHTHGIIIITDAGQCRRGGSRTARVRTTPKTGHRHPTPSSPPKPIGRLIGAFKTVSTKRMNALRATAGKKLWQRNYWDHIVRNEPELQRIREYIQNNPGQWERDSLNADTGGSRTAPTAPPKLWEEIE